MSTASIDAVAVAVVLAGFYLWRSRRARREKQIVRESEERFRRFVDHAVDGFYLSVRGGRFVDVNAAACASLGYTREELLQLSVLDVQRHVDSAALDALWDTMSLGDAVTLETDSSRKDGSVFPSEVRLGLLNAGGETLMLALVRDITARRLSEAELARRAEQQAAVAELGRRAITGVGAESLMQEAVDTLARMLDVPFAEVFELDGEGGPEVLARHIASGLDTEGEGEGIISVIAGRDRPFGAVGVQENGRSFTREDVNFLQAVANVLGAAMTRQREEQLDAKLEGARRLEAVGLLAGGLAHDFNNLLSVMLNYAQFAIDASGDRPELRADLNEIVSAAERASELAGQLLIFSGQDLLHTELTDLNGVIADCRPTLQSLLGDGTSVQLELADDLWPVTAGPGQPAQIARTLAANARDAMPHGGVVTLKTENIRFAEGDEAGGMEPPPGRFVRLTVADTGTGMSDEVAERAFDLFFTTKPIGAGAGLGLPTVYGIAKQLGGFVQIYSEAGQGTAVKVYLPAANSVFAEAEGTETQTAMGHGETILVVDDEDALRRLTERILSGNGYRVIGATDVDTALAAWAEHESVVDLLVTDVVMAGMSGAQLAERFRRSRPELPVLFMSGYTGDMLQIEGVGHRIAVLEKPFSSEGLLREVRAALEGSIR